MFKSVPPTESHAGGILLYINNKLSHKLRQDLCFYKISEVESTFIQIINPKKTNNKQNKYYHWFYMLTSNNESQ